MMPMVRNCLVACAMTVSAAAGVQAAEPSMSFHYVMLNGVSVADCMARSRAALTSNQFTLNESGDRWQYATAGDYLALVACTPSQPTVFFVSVAGPQSPEANRLGSALRAAIESPAAPAGK